MHDLYLYNLLHFPATVQVCSFKISILIQLRFHQTWTRETSKTSYTITSSMCFRELLIRVASNNEGSVCTPEREHGEQCSWPYYPEPAWCRQFEEAKDESFWTNSLKTSYCEWDLTLCEWTTDCSWQRQRWKDSSLFSFYCMWVAGYHAPKCCEDSLNVVWENESWTSWILN